MYFENGEKGGLYFMSYHGILEKVSISSKQSIDL